MALPLVGDAPKGHADAMAAIGNQSKRLDGLVLNGIGNPFVQRHHQTVSRLARESVGEPERRRQFSFARHGEGELRSAAVELNRGREFRGRRHVHQLKYDLICLRTRLGDDEIRMDSLLIPAPVRAPVQDRESGLGQVDAHQQHRVGQEQFPRQNLAAKAPHARALHQ